MPSNTDSVSGGCRKWIQVPVRALAGEGLSPYREGEIRNLFDWAENRDGGSVHLMPHRGQFIVDVVGIETNAIHQPSKPGDELVVVLEGVLTLTNDADGVEQAFRSGEMVLIPAGWAGIYRVQSRNGLFRELAIVPGNYFDPSAAPPPSGLSPRRLELPVASGGHELHRNRYVLQVQNVPQASNWPISASADEVIRVLAGTLTITAAGETASF